ncbi:uncharacterized protein LOC114468754 [Gouania willdenowi]|uniref:uncharacterized protein LOC114468754 n=1 Tax=Gouania willdenowi TaxID=441366 RepID=UPI001056538D|nr:uncharacterized protein LOC114468754 [Gouania willdenowi]
MSSLVGYGVSSDSDSDKQDERNDEPQSAKEVVDEKQTPQKPRNFWLDPDSASSDSEEEPEPSSTPQPLGVPTPRPRSSASNKLPSPPFKACSNNSVFSNPFKAQADQTLNVLQKHVPLTMQAKPSQIGGKKMCVSYRRDGRCRFGIKCKFAHDSDLQNPNTTTASHLSVSEQGSEQNLDVGGSRSSQVEAKEDGSDSQHMKKKRVGLSDTLVPPKKAMKQFAMQRQREKLHMS